MSLLSITQGTQPHGLLYCAHHTHSRKKKKKAMQALGSYSGEKKSQRHLAECLAELARTCSLVPGLRTPTQADRGLIMEKYKCESPLKCSVLGLSWRLLALPNTGRITGHRGRVKTQINWYELLSHNINPVCHTIDP